MSYIDNFKEEMQSSGYVFEYECENLVAVIEFKTYFLIAFSSNPDCAYVTTFFKRTRRRKANYSAHNVIEGTLQECLTYMGKYMTIIEPETMVTQSTDS